MPRLTATGRDDIEPAMGQALQLGQHGGDAFARRLNERAQTVTELLDSLLGETPEPGEIMRPQRLLAAMRYAVLAGGKRWRPFLLVETAAMFGAHGDGPLNAAAALECIHCYSLVHDDLPAMDDDDLRRGRPTVHRAFDEATAILAGDSLLTLAFDIASRPVVHNSPRVRADFVRLLARAAGLGGMAGGQMLDLAGEGGEADAGSIERMQAMKTGALIEAACRGGALIGGATAGEMSALARYGAAIGRAFQIADDLLDATASTALIVMLTGKV
jgi:farnesyl diphosphate synthase